MSATATLREIAQLDAEIAALEQQRKDLEAARREALADRDPNRAQWRVVEIDSGFDGGPGFGSRPGLRDVIRHLGFKRERRQALEEQLPTAAEKAVARKEIQQLARQLGECDAEAQVHDASVAIRLCLEAVARAANARRRHFELKAAAYAKAADVGVEAPDLPDPPVFDPKTARAASILGEVLAVVGSSSPSSAYISSGLAAQIAKVLELEAVATP